MPRKPKSITLEDGAVVGVGELVSYYRNGWRIGHLDEIDKRVLWIKPLALPGKFHRRVSVGLGDVKPIRKETVQ